MFLINSGSHGCTLLVIKIGLDLSTYPILIIQFIQIMVFEIFFAKILIIEREFYSASMMLPIND